MAALVAVTLILNGLAFMVGSASKKETSAGVKTMVLVFAVVDLAVGTLGLLL